MTKYVDEQTKSQILNRHYTHFSERSFSCIFCPIISSGYVELKISILPVRAIKILVLNSYPDMLLRRRVRR